MGRWIEDISGVYKLPNGRWAKDCPSCKTTQTYLRHNYAIESFKLKKLCKSCSNRITDNCHRGLYRTVRVSWFNKFKTSAELRGLPFLVTIEDITTLYESQNGVCALSGLPIGWAEVGSNHTVSIDRVDSKQGYLLNNIQLIYKDINMMKQSFDQDYFIMLCQHISDRNDNGSP